MLPSPLDLQNRTESQARRRRGRRWRGRPGLVRRARQRMAPRLLQPGEQARRPGLEHLQRPLRVDEQRDA